MIRTGTRARRWAIYLLLMIGGTTGIAALILPFTYDTSPIAVARWAVEATRAEGVRALVKDFSLLALASSFFLTVLVSSAAARWIISGSFSRAEKAIAYILSGSTMSSTLWICLIVLPNDATTSRRELVWLITLPLVTLLLGGLCVIRIWRGSRDLTALIALEVAYLGNCVLSLVAFLGGWQRGAYCALATAIVYVLHLIFVSADAS